MADLPPYFVALQASCMAADNARATGLVAEPKHFLAGGQMLARLASEHEAILSADDRAALIGIAGMLINMLPRAAGDDRPWAALVTERIVADRDEASRHAIGPWGPRHD